MSRPCRLMVAAGVGAGLLSTAAAAAPSLDQAVAAQLKGGCKLLLHGDPVTRLEDPLFTACRAASSVVPPVTAASGGGAATPGGAAGILQQLQREKLLAANQAGGAGAAASGDAATLELGGRLTVSLLAGYQALDKDASRYEDGYESDIGNGALAVSYRIRPQLFAGLALDYWQQSGNYDQGGDFETRSYGISAFGGGQLGDHLLVGVAAGYAHRHDERTRIVGYVEGDTDNPLPIVPPGPVDADFGGDVYQAELTLAAPWWLAGVTVAPLASLTWSLTDYEDYSETGDTGLELHFAGDRDKSLLLGLGVGASTVVSVGRLSLVPAAELKWLHEFDRERRENEVSFVDDTAGERFHYATERADRNFGSLALGLTAVLPNGLRPFVGGQAIFGRGLYESYAVTLGLSFDL